MFEEKQASCLCVSFLPCFRHHWLQASPAAHTLCFLRCLLGFSSSPRLFQGPDGSDTRPIESAQAFLLQSFAVGSGPRVSTQHKHGAR